MRPCKQRGTGEMHMQADYVCVCVCVCVCVLCAWVACVHGRTLAPLQTARHHQRDDTRADCVCKEMSRLHAIYESSLVAHSCALAHDARSLVCVRAVCVGGLCARP